MATILEGDWIFPGGFNVRMMPPTTELAPGVPHVGDWVDMREAEVYRVLGSSLFGAAPVTFSLETDLGIIGGVQQTREIFSAAMEDFLFRILGTVSIGGMCGGRRIRGRAVTPDGTPTVTLIMLETRSGIG